jgi:hypothetical protein
MNLKKMKAPDETNINKNFDIKTATLHRQPKDIVAMV